MKNRIILQFLIYVIGSLSLISSVLGGERTVEKPKEIMKESPLSLPAIWDLVRQGHWLHGVNWPWDNYGTDFGSNAWGYWGLANQGPAGWRKETKKNIAAANRLFWTQRETNDYCLGVEVNLKDTSSAIIFFDVGDPAEKEKGKTLDLSGQTVTVQLFLPSGIQGSDSTFSLASLFFQDSSWEWAESGMNIENTDQWITLSANLDSLGHQYPKFNKQQVEVVGIKIGTNSEAHGFSYDGNFYIDNLAASDTTKIFFDFNIQKTRSEKEINDLTDSTQVNCLRWWLFADGRSGLVFDQNGYVIGLNEHFWNDFNEMIRLARSTKTYIVLVLFDFWLGGNADTVSHVPIYGHADLISDQYKRKSLLDSAISKIFDTLAVTNEVVIVDLMNEPEWLLLNSDLNISIGNRPEHIQPGGVVALNAMKTFFSEIIGLHKSKHLKQPLTIGSVSKQWVALWDSLDVNYRTHIDSFYIAQFHLWNRAGNIDEGKKLDSISPSRFPIILGEFTTLSDIPDTSSTYLEKALSLGYSGAFPWAYRAKDSESILMLGKEMKDSLKQFAVRHSDTVRFDVTNIKGKSWDGQPKGFVLHQNYPNPFNPSTTISFAIHSKAYVTLKVFDIIGREIETIASEELSPGTYSRQWNAANMSSGIYFYRLQAGKFTETKKLVLLR